MSLLKKRVKDLQNLMKRHGYSPGLTDGVFGQKSKSALDQYLQPSAKPLTARPWMDEAERLVGTKEIVGKQHNPLIIGWGKRMNLWYPNDEIPWCGLFVAHCITKALPGETIPDNPLGARQWDDFGVECVPQVGSVLIFWRGTKAGWKGHVGFYHAEDATAYHVLGGNQSNAVNVKRISKSRLLASRWPETAFKPSDFTRTADATGKLSTNEA